MTYKLLEKFSTHCIQPLRFKLLIKTSLREIQKEKRYWENFFLDFSGFLYRDQGYFDQYAGSVMKVIKAFFNYLLIEKGLPVGQFHKRFRIPQERLTPVVLTPAQLNFLISNKDFENSLSVSLKRTKDIFVFGCTVGLRYSDLMRLKKINVRNDIKGTVLQITTSKTGAEVSIPLPEYAVALINKYRRKAGVYLLPRLANSNLNLQVKRIIEKAGWTYPLPKMRHRQGKLVEVKTGKGNNYRFCDHICAHTMRRTAITTLLMMGVPEVMVRKISGHAPGSKEFYKYVDIVQNYLDEKVTNAFQQLLKE
jgi:integrase